MYIEYGVYGDLIRIYPNPYSIYLRGTVALCRVHSTEIVWVLMVRGLFQNFSWHDFKVDSIGF